MQRLIPLFLAGCAIVGNSAHQQRIDALSQADADTDADADADTDADADAVAEICSRLDGIALAIELAAARMVSMTPTDVSARLNDRFRLLSGPRRAAWNVIKRCGKRCNGPTTCSTTMNRRCSRRVRCSPAGSTPCR